MTARARNNVNEFGDPQGRPILFSHGFGCDQNMWRDMVPYFESDHRVVLFDHVGFGGSDRAAWSDDRHGELSTYADELLEIIAELELSDVVFVGHSVASMIGVLAAAAAPDPFAHLVLVGPSPRYIDDPDAGYVGGFSDADIESLLDSLSSNYLGWSATMAPVIMGNGDRPELGDQLRNSFCRTDPAVAALFARATFRSDNRDDLARVRIPTLVLQCTDDPIAPDQVGQFVAEHIVGAELVNLRATGHCPNVSAPAETAAAIRTYLDRDLAAQGV